MLLNLTFFHSEQRDPEEVEVSIVYPNINPHLPAIVVKRTIRFPSRYTITRSVTEFLNYDTKFLIENTTLKPLFGKFHKLLNSPTAVEDILRTFLMNEAGILIKLGEQEDADSYVTTYIETIQFQLLDDESDCVGYIQTTGGKCLSEWLSEDHSFEELQRIVREAARCLKFCHDHQVIHGDVKPDNFVVDATGRVRIIDFGCSTYKEPATGFFGTIGYMAPNVADPLIRDSYDDNSIDIFSFGVFTKIIMLRLHSRKAYEWFEQIELVRAGWNSIEDGKKKRFISFNKDELQLSAGLSSDQAGTVLDFCARTEIIATANGYDRPQFANFDEILEHPLMKLT